MAGLIAVLRLLLARIGRLKNHHAAPLTLARLREEAPRAGAGAGAPAKLSSSMTRRPQGVSSQAFSRREPLRGVTFSISP
ncbi:MAG: hypothetical protein ACHP7P_15270, partial [Terriglobales bacterium]